MRKFATLVFLSVATLGLACWAAAQERSANAGANPNSTDPAVSTLPVPAAGPVSSSQPTKAPAPPHTDLPLRIEGERRFRANCGRCHAAPQKYSPRVAATTVRHMRVRATLTDEDMRYILAYITQ